MEKLRRALLGILLMAAAGVLAMPAHGADRLLLNGADLWEQAEARYIGQTTYVSLRTVAQALRPDADIYWRDGAAWVVTDDVTIRACPGEQWMTVNDRAFYIPDGVAFTGSRVLVPVRVIARALGAEVDWSRGEGVTIRAGTGRPAAQTYTEDELYWLARIISAESRGEPLEGKLAVGTVVLNRVASSDFPDTVYGVIFDRQWGVQFTPVANGTVYDEPTQESVLAAKLVLDGARAAGESLYFIAPHLTENHWTMEHRTYITTIGCHWFYR